MKFKSATMFIIALAFAGILLQDWMHPIPGLAEEDRLGAVTDNVRLRRTPGLNGDIIAGLQKGLPVKVYGEKDGWYRVSARKNYKQLNGWVYKRYVEIVSVDTPSALPEIKISPPLKASGQPIQSAKLPPASSPPAKVKRNQPSPAVMPAKPAAPASVKSVTPPTGNQKTAADKQDRQVSEKHSTSTATEKPAATAAGSSANSSVRLLLSISPLVLAIIALLVAVRAFRANRTPASEDSSPQSQPEPVCAEASPTITPGKQPVNEKRRAPRLNRLVEVDFAIDGKFYRGFINNLSETGVYVDTPEKFTVGQEITISCPAIDTGGHVKRDGMIVRLTETGIAVHFQQGALP